MGPHYALRGPHYALRGPEGLLGAGVGGSACLWRGLSRQTGGGRGSNRACLCAWLSPLLINYCHLFVNLIISYDKYSFRSDYILLEDICN